VKLWELLTGAAQGNTEDSKPVVKLSWHAIGVLWSILAGIVTIIWHSYQFEADQKAQSMLLTSQVATLAQAVSRLEDNMQVADQMRYTASDAQRDLGLIHTELADHEQRIIFLEHKRR
jgi:hypothetical protein